MGTSRLAIALTLTVMVVLAGSPSVGWGQDAMIPSPSLESGNWWTFQTWDRSREAVLDTWTVKRIEDGRFVIHSQGREAIYTSDWGLVQEVILEAKPVWLLYSPPLQLLSFPLWVGKAWESSTIVNLQSGPTSVTTTHNVSVRVLRWEKVQVSAGTFRAVRLALQLQAGMVSATADCWYAAEAQNFVRCISKDNPRYDFDLMRFNAGFNLARSRRR